MIKFSEAMRAYKKFPEDMIDDQTSMHVVQETLVAVNRRKLPARTVVWDKTKKKWFKMDTSCPQSA